MRYLFIYIALFIHVSSAFAQQKAEIKRPKLVVGIVVDQMRWDYLYRYYERFGDGGFRRMMNEGFNCQNTMINFLPTFTGPGHASIYTGTVPAIHGITANDWYEMDKVKKTYCVHDLSVTRMGGSFAYGHVSPGQMFTTTITDELKIATKERAKVFGIGIKDRGSVLPAGHMADGAYWFDDNTGTLMTSTYYRRTLPDWLHAFNELHLPDTFINNRTWDLLYDVSTYVNSTADDNEYEGTLRDEEHPVFPHNVKGKSYNTLKYIPLGNTYTFRAAKACIKGEEIGQDEITDFLCVTLSSTDYAGHLWGPDAIELEDMYLRLDRSIASFLSYLDKNVGEGNYTVFLTADHGAANNSRYMHDLKYGVGNKPKAIAERELRRSLSDKFGTPMIIKPLANYQVYFDEQEISNQKVNREELKAYIRTWLLEQEGVAYVADMENLNEEVIPEPIKTMIINGYYKERCGVLQIIMKPGWYSGYGETGTTHGSWNPYDSHIPLLWYGWGINKGETYRTVHMTDIAPTIAALLHIQMPNGCIGNVITEVIE